MQGKGDLHPSPQGAARAKDNKLPAPQQQAQSPFHLVLHGGRRIYLKITVSVLYTSTGLVTSDTGSFVSATGLIPQGLDVSEASVYKMYRVFSGYVLRLHAGLILISAGLFVLAAGFIPQH